MNLKAACSLVMATTFSLEAISLCPTLWVCYCFIQAEKPFRNLPNQRRPTLLFVQSPYWIIFANLRLCFQASKQPSAWHSYYFYCYSFHIFLYSRRSRVTRPCTDAYACITAIHVLSCTTRYGGVMKVTKRHRVRTFRTWRGFPFNISIWVLFLGSTVEQANGYGVFGIWRLLESKGLNAVGCRTPFWTAWMEFFGWDFA